VFIKATFLEHGHLLDSQMKMYLASLIIFILIQIISSNYLNAQTSPMPTTPTGTNNIVYDSTLQKYFFQFNGEAIYEYYIGDGKNFYNSGATFNAIKAKAVDGNWFWPSYVGGINAQLSSIEKKPWEIGVTYERFNHSLSKNTVIAEWRMKYDNDYIDYTYRLQISGKTLIIMVESKNSSTKASGLELDRCENAADKRIIYVPYLTLFNLLYSDNSYTSLFVDWESTNASGIVPLDPIEYSVPDSVSTKSIRFSQRIIYNHKTDGFRNPLKETLYLTVSSNIDEVLPNLVGPISPRRLEAASKTVISYGPPYTWMFNPPDCSIYDYKYFQEIKDRGVENIAVIIKQYQRHGYDSGYPEVLPANDWDNNQFSCNGYLHPCENTSNSKNQLLIDTKNSLNALGYSVALHENYVECYANGSASFDPLDCAVGPTGIKLRGWPTGGCAKKDTAFYFNTGKSKNYLTTWSEEIRQKIGPNFGYLDVSSAANPTWLVDYDADEEESGKFKYVLNNIRSFPNILRSKYHGFVQGEGNNHFLYAGYFDDLEATLFTANKNLYGYKAPLFVDFDLKKMHGKSAYHGVGYFYLFFAPNLVANKLRDSALTWDEILINTATELAYGHNGIIAKTFVMEKTMDQAVLENTHVLPVAKALIDAKPLSILYGNSYQTASDYIKSHPGYADISNTTDFMGKVNVIYDNGIIVYVNRHPIEPWTVTISMSGKWVSYHAIVNDSKELYAGQSNHTIFTLPPNNGWIVYNPN